MFRILSVLLKQWPVACDLCFVPAVDGRSEQASKAYVKNAKQLEHVQSACVRSLSLVLRGRESQQFYINDRWIRFNRKIIKEEDYMTLQKTTKWIEITSLPKDRANTQVSSTSGAVGLRFARNHGMSLPTYPPFILERNNKMATVANGNHTASTTHQWEMLWLLWHDHVKFLLFSLLHRLWGVSL